MPFYDALHYVLSTADGKVKRKSWNDNNYIMRKIDRDKIYIVLHIRDEQFVDFKCDSEILVSEDWVIAE